MRTIILVETPYGMEAVINPGNQRWRLLIEGDQAQIGYYGEEEEPEVMDVIHADDGMAQFLFNLGLN